MDESVKLFQEEQEQFAKAGGPVRWLMYSMLINVISLALFILVAGVLFVGLRTLPRNADQSFQVIYDGPILVVLAACSALTLRRYRSMPPWLRPTLWALIALALLIVPAQLYDLFRRNGS